MILAGGLPNHAVCEVYILADMSMARRREGGKKGWESIQCDKPLAGLAGTPLV